MFLRAPPPLLILSPCGLTGFSSIVHTSQNPLKMSLLITSKPMIQLISYDYFTCTEAENLGGQGGLEPPHFSIRGAEPPQNWRFS